MYKMLCPMLLILCNIYHYFIYRLTLIYKFPFKRLVAIIHIHLGKLDTYTILKRFAFVSSTLLLELYFLTV